MKAQLIQISRGYPLGEPLEQDIEEALDEVAKWAESINGSIEEITTPEGGLESVTIRDKNGNPVRTYAVC